jgi:hypothetical protein
VRMSRPLRHDPFATSSAPGPLVPATAGSPRGIDSRQRADTVAGHTGAEADEARMSRPLSHDPFGASSTPGPLVPATAGSPRGVDSRQRADTVVGHIGAGAHEARMSRPFRHDPFAASSAPGPQVPATAGSPRGVDARQQADTVAGHTGAGADAVRMSRPLRHDPFARSSAPGPLVPATAGSLRGVDARQQADTVAGHIGAGAHEARMSAPSGTTHSLSRSLIRVISYRFEEAHR